MDFGLGLQVISGGGSSDLGRGAGNSSLKVSCFLSVVTEERASCLPKISSRISALVFTFSVGSEKKSSFSSSKKGFSSA